MMILFLFIAIPVWLGGILIIKKGIEYLVEGIQILSWKATKGTILLDEKKSELCYTYSVNGNNFETKKLHKWEENIPSDTKKEIKKRLKSSKTVVIYYNPQKHTEAFLSKKFSLTPIIKFINWTLFGLAIICLGVFVFSIGYDIEIPLFECF